MSDIIVPGRESVVKLFEKYGLKHPLLPGYSLDPKAYQAFESYLNKATGETVYRDWFLWRSIVKKHSVGEAKKEMAGLFDMGLRTNAIRYFERVYSSIERGYESYGEAHLITIVSAEMVYDIGKQIVALDKDGGGLSYSDLVSLAVNSCLPPKSSEEACVFRCEDRKGMNIDSCGNWRDRP